MRKVFISKNYRGAFTASSKAKIDAESIAQQNGYNSIGLSFKTFNNSCIGKIWTVLSNFMGHYRLPKDGVLLLQVPTSLTKYQLKRAQKLRSKVIVLIHDLDWLRNLGESDIGLLQKADVLIAHTPAMKNWLIENQINTNVEVLEIFDYLTNDDYVIDQISKDKSINVAFAGNLGKSKFLNYLTFKSITLKLFGIGYDKLSLQNGVEYQGCYPPEKLGRNLKSDFGLVWDGESTKTCSGIGGEYLRLIAPHKLSMYLSVGMPVIVWEESAMASFVTTNNVGVAIKDLKELESRIGSLTQDEIKNMRENASEIAKRLKSGYYLSNALSRAEKVIFNY